MKTLQFLLLAFASLAASLPAAAQGRFTVANIPPGKYFVFIWGPYGWREGEASETDQGPLRLNLAPDTRTPLGLVHVSWPCT